VPRLVGRLHFPERPIYLVSSREEQWAAKSKVIGAGDRQRQRDGEGGSEQNGAIESASIAAAAIFASFHCASGPSASELAFQPDNALPPDSW